MSENIGRVVRAWAEKGEGKLSHVGPKGFDRRASAGEVAILDFHGWAYWAVERSFDKLKLANCYDIRRLIKAVYRGDEDPSQIYLVKVGERIPETVKRLGVSEDWLRRYAVKRFEDALRAEIELRPWGGNCFEKSEKTGNFTGATVV